MFYPMMLHIVYPTYIKKSDPSGIAFLLYTIKFPSVFRFHAVDSDTEDPVQTAI